jgi:uncharacterized protein YqeY
MVLQEKNMSELKERLNDAVKTAMKAGEKARLATLRLIMADIKRKEVDERIELDDQAIIAILSRMIKQRKESIAQYEAGNRQDLADKEKSEIVVVEEFLPESLSEDEILKVIQQAVEETGATSIKQMGQVMNLIRPTLAGKADMGQVSALIKAKLTA